MVVGETGGLSNQQLPKTVHAEGKIDNRGKSDNLGILSRKPPSQEATVAITIVNS